MRTMVLEYLNLHLGDCLGENVGKSSSTMEHMGTMFDLKNRDFVGLTIELNGPCLQHHGSQLVGFGRSDKAFQVFNTLVDD